MLTSWLALVSVLAFPIAALYGGIVKINLLGICPWLMGQSGNETSFLCEYEFYSFIVVALLVFAPVLSAVLYCCNRGKKTAGVLLLIAPLYLTLIFNFCHSLEHTSLATGGIISLLCGIVLIVLPWIIKEKDERPQISRRLVAILVGSMAFAALVPAIALQYLDHHDKEMRERQKEEWREQSSGDEVVEEDAPVEDVAVEDNIPFISGDIKRYISLRVADLDYSGASYEYRDKQEYNIQIVSDHGSMVMKAWGEPNRVRYMETGTFFYDICDESDEVSTLCEYGFGQYDFDGDGEDELIVAARINSGTQSNDFAVNVYRMGDLHCWSLERPQSGDGGVVTYSHPVVKVADGHITIMEGNGNTNIFTYALRNGKFECIAKKNVVAFDS